MAIIRIDGKAYEVDPRQNLLHACLSLGFNLPYFCWHPAMGSVGACRQCAVKVFRDENDRKGRIVMACMTPAADGTRLSIEDPEAKAFRASVIEWLMANHPHDCPVCDEGGECHLQDMTVMTGHVYRRYRFRKRTFRNQDLGPCLNHEMNRCIQCYRCVRFYRDYAGGRDFEAHSINHAVYFGRHADGVLENVFSGNLAEVCPTGVFTDKTHKRHYARKWDEESAPSVCPHCGLGCNTNPAARYGLLRRVLNRYNAEVNGFFLCDRGRFGYEYVNGGRRIRGPRVRGGRSEPLREGTESETLGRIASLLAGGRRVIGIGSPRASLEANFALRVLVGPGNFFLGTSDADSRHVSLVLTILREGPARAASIRDAEGADAALVLGEDVLQTAPRLALALRQAARQKPLEKAARLKIPLWQDASVRDLLHGERGPLFVATPDATGLDDAAMTTYRAAPEDIARLGFAVAHEIDPAAPAVADLPERDRALAAAIAAALKGAARPLVASGWGHGGGPVVEAAANVAWALCRVGREAAIALTAPECNSVGLGLMGGGGLDEAFREAREGRVDAVIVLENDLYRRADPDAAGRFLAACGHVVVIDSLAGRTVEAADAVLPAAATAEGDGTLVSFDVRAQRFFQVFIPGFESFRDGIPEGGIRESWRWLRAIGRAAGRLAEERWTCLDEVTAEASEAIPSLGGIADAAPPGGFRMEGLKIPRQPPRYSGRTAMFADKSIHEPKSPDDPDAPLSFSMEGYPGQPPPSLIPWFWAPSWNSIQATFRYQAEVGGPLRGIPPGKRLLVPASSKKPSYFGRVPEPFRPRAGEWLVVPLRHVFGSEELSADAPAVAARSPGPYLGLGPCDAVALGVAPGDGVDLDLEGTVLRLPVAIRPALPRGVAGIPAGLPGMPWAGALPRWARVSKVPP